MTSSWVKENKIKKTIQLVSIVGLIFCLSCGIKGPPLPPIDEETIQKQKAEELIAKRQEETAKAAAAASNDATAADKNNKRKKKKSK